MPERKATDPKNEERIYDVTNRFGWVEQKRESEMPEVREQKIREQTSEAPTQPPPQTANDQ